MDSSACGQDTSELFFATCLCRARTDSRIPSIFGGTTEIMKEIIGRSLGL